MKIRLKTFRAFWINDWRIRPLYGSTHLNTGEAINLGRVGYEIGPLVIQTKKSW